MVEEMTPEYKEAFKILIKNLNKGNKDAIWYYDHSGDIKFDKDGLIPRGIINLTYGYSVKDHPEFFGLTQKQAVGLRVYTKQNLFDEGEEYVCSQIEEILKEVQEEKKEKPRNRVITDWDFHISSQYED